MICGLNADVYGLMELENTTATGTITDLLGAVNALLRRRQPVRLRQYRRHPRHRRHPGRADLPLGDPVAGRARRWSTSIRSTTGRPPRRPSTSSIAANPAFGERFTVIANHFKSKGCPGTGADADAGDGAGCFNGTRTDQANRLLTWINGTVLPAAGDPDVLLLGDFNSYAQEDSDHDARPAAATPTWRPPSSARPPTPISSTASSAISTTPLPAPA